MNAKKSSFFSWIFFQSAEQETHQNWINESSRKPRTPPIYIQIFLRLMSEKEQVRVCVRVCVYACERERVWVRKSKWQSKIVCVCVCMCVRERKKEWKTKWKSKIVCECVFVCVWERERERPNNCKIEIKRIFHFELKAFPPHFSATERNFLMMSIIFELLSKFVANESQNRICFTLF